MARILCAWELGSNLGHLAPLAQLARVLQAQGHDVSFAVRDLRHAEELLGRHGFRYVQAPLAHGRHPAARQPVSYADILVHCGFGNEAELAGLLRAWLQLFRLARPELVLADHAPVALLAARAAGLPRALFGNGFSSPPRAAPLPGMRPWLKVPDAVLRSAEEAVLTVANRTLRRIGAGALAALHELLDADEDFLCTHAELDHYPARAGATYWGPVFAPEQGEPPRWPEAGGRRVYVYLRPEHRAFDAVLRALQASRLSVLWYAPGRPPGRASPWQRAHLRFSAAPCRLDEVARCAEFAILHGGHGTVSALLLGGVPMLLLPAHLEQFLVARAAMRLGAAVAAPAARDSLRITASIERLLSGEECASRAAAFAARHRGYDPHRTVAAIGRRIEALLRRPARSPAGALS